VDSSLSDDKAVDSSEGEEEEEQQQQQKKPPCTRLILEHDALKDCMEKNCRCPECNGPIEMKVKDHLFGIQCHALLQG
jgi:hypothetical protein